MIPEFGHFALIIALCMALAQSVLPLIGAARGNGAWMALAKPAAHGQFVFLLVSFACLTWSFVQNDFGRLCREQFEFRIADRLPHRRGMGRA
jgi:cytochrome c-type biogenesis protein CcmF